MYVYIMLLFLIYVDFMGKYVDKSDTSSLITMGLVTLALIATVIGGVIINKNNKEIE